MMSFLQNVLRQALLGVVVGAALIPVAPAVAASPILSCESANICTANLQGHPERIRILGYDAPNMDQSQGPESQQFLIMMLQNPLLDVSVTCTQETLEGARACHVYYGDIHEDIAEAMIQGGHAWDYPKYSGGKYNALQLKAQNLKIGLWILTQGPIVSPYCWRNRGQNVPSCQANPYFEP
jgi:endonuclease YncB( thermonuclease family)